MKIIFIDIDGVLATAPCWGMSQDNKWNAYPFDKKAVKVLNEILKETGAEMVLSSDWKYHYNMEQIKEIFMEFNGVIKSPFDKTPMLPTDATDLEGGRISEIKLWLKENQEKLGVTHWVAVDDLDMGEKFGPISGNYLGGLKNFVHCKRVMEGIKQTSLKYKIIKFLQ